MNTNLVIIPSRSRPNNIDRIVKSLKRNSHISDILVVLDGDDPIPYQHLQGVMYETFTPRLFTVPKINRAANIYADQYETITFLGDDQVIHTPRWDVILNEPLQWKGYGISYGDDGFQGERMCTSVMMTTNIIKALGHMGLPTLKHLYVDNFWMTIGQELESFWYFPYVSWEHLHYLNNKAEKDLTYLEGNSPERYFEDGLAFEQWLNGDGKSNDVARLKQMLGIDGE